MKIQFSSYYHHCTPWLQNSPTFDWQAVACKDFAIPGANTLIWVPHICLSKLSLLGATSSGGALWIPGTAAPSASSVRQCWQVYSLNWLLHSSRGVTNSRLHNLLPGICRCISSFSTTKLKLYSSKWTNLFFSCYFLVMPNLNPNTRLLIWWQCELKELISVEPSSWYCLDPLVDLFYPCDIRDFSK